MSLEERDSVLAMLAARRPPPGTPPPDIAARRVGFEDFAAALWPDIEPPPPTSVPSGLPGRMIAAPGQPLLLWLHGGAFSVGSSASHWGMAASAITELDDFGLMLPDYALAPEQPFPAALAQILALLAALDSAGFPAHRLALGGDSAGANLAVAAIQARIAAGEAPPAACWLISPYLDLTNGGASIAGRRARDVFVDPDDGTNRRYAGDTPLDDPRLSPLSARFDGFPESLVQVGSEEVLQSDSQRLVQALWNAGRPATFQEWEGMMHVWPLFAPRLEEGRAAIAQGAAFLHRIFQA